jgi:hypothetical protein
MQIETFNRFFVYNNYQCSGYLDLENRGKGRFVKNVWQINKFRDLVDDYSLPFIENDTKELITSNINVLKHWTKQKRFDDSVIVIRLEYDNLDNNKLSLYDIDVIERKILR